MTPKVAEALAAVGQALAAAQEPWWIIGSAAVALHGVRTSVADIDVLLSMADVENLIAGHGLNVVAPDFHPQFRSARFVRWTRNDSDVEFMVGLKVCQGGVWHPVLPITRVAFAVGDTRVFAPDRNELGLILQRFGRSKDRQRLRALRGCTGAPG